MGLIGGLLRYILIGVAIYVLYRVLKGWLSGLPPGQRGNMGSGARPREVVDVMVQDPQCGVYIPRHEALRVMAEGGQERFFCSEACRDVFLAGKKQD